MKMGAAISNCLRWMSWEYEGVIYALQLDLCGGHGAAGWGGGVGGLPPCSTGERLKGLNWGVNPL